VGVGVVTVGTLTFDTFMMVVVGTYGEILVVLSGVTGLVVMSGDVVRGVEMGTEVDLVGKVYGSLGTYDGVFTSWEVEVGNVNEGGVLVEKDVVKGVVEVEILVIGEYVDFNVVVGTESDTVVGPTSVVWGFT